MRHIRHAHAFITTEGRSLHFKTTLLTDTHTNTHTASPQDTFFSISQTVVIHKSWVDMILGGRGLLLQTAGFTSSFRTNETP